MCTGVAMRLGGEARKGLRLTMALGPWGCGLWCERARGGVAVPRPMEHEAQPHKSDQHQRGEKEIRDHGKTPSYRWRNEGILPGLSGYRISRRLEVHDRSLWQAFVASVRHLAAEKHLDLTVLHGDGTNTVAKKGGMGLGIPGTHTRRARRSWPSSTIMALCELPSPWRPSMRRPWCCCRRACTR